MAKNAKQVRRRRVFHIPGYDPMHPRRYRELYRTEGAAQAAISGYRIRVQAASSQDSFCWDVTGEFAKATVKSRIDVLMWSDIVRDSMAQSIPATYLQLLKTAWTYIGTGALFRLMRLRKGPIIAALYPVVFLLAQLGIAVGAGWLLGGAAAQIVGAGTGEGAFAAWLALTAQWFVLGLVATVILRWFKSLDNRVFAYYLTHDYAFSANANGAYPERLEARLDQFADQIAAALQETTDEVLVVGHSSGAHLAISIVADLLRDGRVPRNGPTLSLLTLGQVVPMVSFLPKADRLRADLKYLSENDALAWVDVTAPGDGCCFALCDPVAVSGVAGQSQKWPLVLSAAFTKTLSASRWRQLRWRFFRLHFQYLCAFDQPQGYDYFQITAGPMTLRDRFAGRGHSRSRFAQAISKYRSVA
ncbi:hypothetical protein [Yoonia litorea]|uniref:Lipase (Class 3) n=1 Tax=Yoonia litorea TaxID=1123755 RepID=A0A1I6M8A0_9RHOB|nr:hypothetical protein [Yoonia litorea]SFS11762.1 hypothetical protein SAMN05444714_1348 [Yoonia litorea]